MLSCRHLFLVRDVGALSEAAAERNVLARSFVERDREIVRGDLRGCDDAVVLPAGGGRPTDPRWTERRLVPLALKTLERLEDITAWVRKHEGINLEPMQLAARILEKTTSQLSEAEAEKLVRPQRRASH